MNSSRSNSRRKEFGWSGKGTRMMGSVCVMN